MLGLGGITLKELTRFQEQGQDGLVWVVSSKDVEHGNKFVGQSDLAYSFSEWTLTEWKLFCVIVSIVTASEKSDAFSKGVDDSLKVAIPLRILREKLGIGKTNAVKQIESALEGLRTKKISRLNLSDDGVLQTGVEQDFFTVAFVATEKASGEKGRDRLVKIELNKMLRPYIFELHKSFFKEDLSVMLNFNSVHSLKMYLVFSLVLRQNTKEGVVVRTYPLSTLKQFLGLHMNDYMQFCDLQKRVLDPATEELKNKGLLNVTYNENRNGKGKRSAVSSVSVYISEGDSFKRLQEPPTPASDDDVRESVRNGLALREDKKLLEKLYRKSLKKIS